MNLFNIFFFWVQNANLAISRNGSIIWKVNLCCWWLFIILIWAKIETLYALLCDRVSHCWNSINIRANYRIFIVSFHSFYPLHHLTRIINQWSLLCHWAWIQWMNDVLVLFRPRRKHSVVIRTCSILCSLLWTLMMSWRCCSIVRCSSLSRKIQQISFIRVLRHEWGSSRISWRIKLVLFLASQVVVVNACWGSLKAWVSNHFVLFDSFHS